MIVHGHVTRTRRVNAPDLVHKTPGLTMQLRLVKLRAQLKQVDDMLKVATDRQTRTNLHSARNSLMGSIAYCEAYELRTRPSYA